MGTPAKAMPEPGYYAAKAPRFMRGFDRVAKRLGKRLSARYGEGFSNEVLADARQEYARILPELPYIGGWRNYFTPVIVANGWIIALYRAMKAHGKPVEDVIGVCCEAADDFFAGLPRPVLRLGGKLAAGGLVKNALRNQGDRSRARRHPEDFVYSVREGGEDDLVLEFTECAVNKLYEAQHVEELKPFCNFFDVVYSRRMGLGLDASETIGLGCGVCRLRYKRGRETQVPERLVDLLPPE